jgi:hypothetical protein
MKRIVFAGVIFFSAVQIAAEDSSFTGKELNFIRQLFKKNRYFDCIAESRKLQNNDNKAGVEYFVYSNYFLAGQYSSVIFNYFPESFAAELKFPSTLLLSQSYLKAGFYNESYELLKKIDYGMFPEKYYFTMFLRRVEPLLLSGDADKINREISDSQLFLKDSYDFMKLRQELELYAKEGLKSPSCAAIMSALLPGLGQCYSGYPGEGFVSLLAVAGAAGAGLYMKDRGQKGLSCTFFFFSGLFYTGNIYGAYKSAEYKNNEILLKRHKSITGKYGSYNPGEYIDMESIFR